MKKENIQNEFVVRCGKTTDSMEILEKTCKEEPGFPELICVGKFKRDESGKVIYELDFSESTL